MIIIVKGKSRSASSAPIYLWVIIIYEILLGENAGREIER